MIALLVIDMQNAYFEAPELASQQEQLVASCNRLLEAFKAGGHKALMVGTEHERDKSTWTLNMLDDDQGFIFRDSEQAQAVPGLSDRMLAERLRELEAEGIVSRVVPPEMPVRSAP